MKILQSLTFALLFYVTNAAALEYYAHPSGECPAIHLELKGPIEKNDSTAFLKVLNDVNLKNKNRSCKLFEIRLSSPGGDVNEAMKIGRMIRERELLVKVDKGNQCLSSCVLILGAGVVRTVFEARVGIHRPYFVTLDKGLSTTEIQSLRKQMISRMKAYADEMDLSDRLIDDMMSTPPERIKILSLTELDQYRLSGVDASFDEKRTNNYAQEIGISSSELRKRSSEADKYCNSQSFGPGRGFDINRLNQCKQAIIWNVSEPEIIRRERLIADKCSGMLGDSPARWECVMKTLREGR
jgi:ATP-dependent protease ClpP protease subunit